jgi:hypothetical protein
MDTTEQWNVFIYEGETPVLEEFVNVPCNTSRAEQIKQHLKANQYRPRIYYNADTNRYQVCSTYKVQEAIEGLSESKYDSRFNFTRLDGAALVLLENAALENLHYESYLRIYYLSTLKTYIASDDSTWLILDKTMPGYIRVPHLNRFYDAVHIVNILADRTGREFTCLELNDSTKTWINTLTFSKKAQGK